MYVRMYVYYECICIQTYVCMYCMYVHSTYVYLSMIVQLRNVVYRPQAKILALCAHDHAVARWDSNDVLSYTAHT